MKSKLNLIVVVLLVFFFSDCKKEGNNDTLQVKDINVVDVSSETDWNYWVVGKEGGYMLIKVQNSLPKTVFYKPSKDLDGYPIYFDDSGMPEKAIVAGYIFIFGNFNGYNMDVTIVNPNGVLEVVRNIKTDFDFSNYFSKGSADSNQWSDIIRWAGRGVSIGACGIGIATTLGTAGAGFPLALLGCGATFIGVTTEFLPENYQLLGLSATAVGAFATLAGCVNGSATCVLGLTSLATKAISARLEDIENNDVLIQNVPIRTNLFLTKTDIEILSNQGMNIFQGLTPPDITGNYYLNSWTNLSTGLLYMDYSYKFYNFTSDLKIDLEYAASGSSATGLRALLAGANSQFSVFCEVDETDNDNGNIVKIKLATIYSATVTEAGLQGFQKGFIVIEKENDIYSTYMDVGDSRIVYEADNMADEVSTFPYVPIKKAHPLQALDLTK